MTAPTLRALLAEDNPDDAELLLRELKRAGLRVTHCIVDSREAYLKALREFAPDVILSDFSMPGFDGMEALRLAVEFAADTPFIFVSGTLGEEYAIRALHNGATDYVLKTNLLRLPAAVERALFESEVRRARRRTEMELQIARERLQEREAGLARAQHMAKLAHVITGSDGSFKTWSDSLPRLIGVEHATLPRSTREWLDRVHPEDRETLRLRSIGAASSGERMDVQYRVRHESGAWIHMTQVMERLDTQSADGQEGKRWFNTLQDVTEHKEAQDKIRRLNRVYAVLSAINALILRVRDREELFIDACRIAVEEGLLAMAWIGILDRASMQIVPVAWSGNVGDMFRAGRHRLWAGTEDNPVAVVVAQKRAFVSNDVANDERIALKDEHAARGIRSLAMLPLVAAGEVAGIISLYAAEEGYFDDEEMKLLRELAGDISFAIEHIGKEEKLNYLAFYDSLTGLANQTLFLERVTQSIHSAGQHARTLGVVALDIERFKAINDSFGRQAGDTLLKQVAERLTGLQDSGEVARIGADQFAVMVPDLRHIEELARVMAERSRALFGVPYRVADTELRVGARAGIAVFPNDGADAETLLRNAESALKNAKSSGSRHLFYAPEMTARIAENLALENSLRRAIANDEFVLHYQPKVDVETRRIVGAEALIRWQSPDQGLVPPMKFIPLLEETGLIIEVGAWAIRQAVRDHRRWLGQGLRAPRIAVNVSAIQLQQKDFIQTLEAAMREGGKPPAIDLEITESLLMQDIERNIAKLRQARELGLAVAIDDFGTGHSSLAYLAKLPLDALKIDRSFIITMLKEPDTMTLVQTMVSLAHSLRLKVTAEGVETDDQAAVLRRLNCDEMQGYLVSKPVPWDKFGDLLRE